MEKPKVLVIENDLITANTIVQALEEIGVIAETARNGLSGLKKASSIQPDLIILDVRLVEIDGFEVCRRLKANETTKDTPVIFMTALSSTEDKVKGFKAGAVDFITKPFRLREVAMRIAVHLHLDANNLPNNLSGPKDQYYRELGDDMISDIAQSVVRSDLHFLAVFVTDLNLNIIYSNTRAVWVLGYSDFSGLRFSPDLIAPEYRKIFNSKHPRMTLFDGVSQFDCVGIKLGYGGTMYCGCKIYPVFSQRTQDRYGFYIKLLDTNKDRISIPQPTSSDSTTDISFTRSERFVLRCALGGMSVKLTANSLNITERTVQNHRQNIRRKIGPAANKRSFEQIAQDFKDLIN